MRKSLTAWSFTPRLGRRSNAVARREDDDGLVDKMGKNQGLVRRLSRSFFAKFQFGKGKSDVVLGSTPDLNIAASAGGQAETFPQRKGSFFTVVSNVDSASPCTDTNGHSKHSGDAKVADQDQDISRRSSSLSIKSTPMQILLTRAGQMMPHKVITNSTTVSVKEVIDGDKNVENSAKPHSALGNVVGIHVECDRIIDSVSSVWNSSLQDISYENHSKKSLLFTVKKKASVDLKTYMTRLVRIINKVYDSSMYDREGAGVRCLLLSTIYIERILKLNDDLELTNLNIHRLFLGAFMLALKMYEDELPQEESLAEYAGVSVQQLHSIESKFFELVKFQLVVKTDEYLNLFTKTQILCNIDFKPEVPSWMGFTN